MKRMRLGTSTLKVGALGIGCWTFGGGSYWGPQTQTSVEQVVHQALDMGGNRPERAIVPDRSLLVDMYGTLQDLIHAGKILAIGVSNHGVRQLQDALSASARPVADELIYNLLSRAIEKDILPCCREREIGVIAYMPLHQGLLTGKYETIESVPSHVARTRHFHHARSADSRHQGTGEESLLFQTLNELRGLAKRIGVSLDALSLAWVMQQSGVAVATVGCRNLQQLMANTRSLEHLLSAQTMAELNEITSPLHLRLGDDPDYYEPPGRSRIS